VAQWIDYYGDLTPPPDPPPSYTAQKMTVRPVEKKKIRFIHDGDFINLGNRKFKIIVSRSHTEDSVILYDAENGVLFTGDVFVSGGFYVLNFEEFFKDLGMLAALDVAYHYNTHGPQLLELKARGEVLRAAQKIQAKQVKSVKAELFGQQRDVYRVDGFVFWFLPELLMY